MSTKKGSVASEMMPRRCFFHSYPIKGVSKQRALVAKSDTKTHLGIPDSEVKRRTGFPCETSLLSYVFVVIIGGIDIIKARKKSLTWHQECFIHFECKWGKAFMRVVYVEQHFGLTANHVENHRRKVRD